MRLRVLALALLPALFSGAVASAQLVNGGFNTPTSPASSSNVWGSLPGGAGYGTVNWTTGGQYAYDPSNVAGWTFVGGAGVQQNGSAWGFTNAPGGLGQSAFLQDYNGPINVPRANPSTISQFVGGLTSGDTYYLTFYMEQRDLYGPAPVTVLIGINGIQYIAADTPSSSSSWQLYTVAFDAASYPELITFAAYNPASGTYDNDTGIADVALSSTAPTVPSTPAILAPEGGAAFLYLLLAAGSCFGAMFLISRNKFANLVAA
jgi:hypothetical protein